MRGYRWGVCLLVLPAGVLGNSQTGNSPAPPTQAAGPGLPPAQAQTAQPPTPTTYTLTPEQRAKAVAYSRSLYVLYFIGTLVSLGIYLFLWRSGIAVTFREWARKVSRRHFVQCLIFVPLFAAAATLLNLPVEFYSSYVLEHRFGLSTQGLASWFGDWGKSLAVVAAIGVIVAWIFYTVVRRSPRRWWFYFWLASIPLVLTFILIEPYAIEPLFYHFTPLQKTQPALVERIEAMLNHAGLSIPPARILESGRELPHPGGQRLRLRLGSQQARRGVGHNPEERWGRMSCCWFSDTKPATTSSITFPKNLFSTRLWPCSSSFWDFSP